MRSRIHQRSSGQILPRLPPILEAEVLDRLHHMLPPGRTYPGQKHQNTSREVHFSQLLAQLILVILSRFPRFCKSYVLITFSFPRDVLPSYLHQAATGHETPPVSLQFHLHFCQTPPHTTPSNFWPHAARNHFFENWYHNILRCADNKDFKSRKTQKIQPLRKSRCAFALHCHHDRSMQNRPSEAPQIVVAVRSQYQRPRLQPSL